MKYTVCCPVYLNYDGHEIKTYWYFSRYDCGNYTINDCQNTYRVTSRYLQKVFPDAYKELIKKAGVRYYAAS